MSIPSKITFSGRDIRSFVGRDRRDYCMYSSISDSERSLEAGSGTSLWCGAGGAIVSSKLHKLLLFWNGLIQTSWPWLQSRLWV